MLRYIFIALGLITGSNGQTMEITGELTYRERVALPPTASAFVELHDISRSEVPSVLIAQERIDLAGRQVPVPFRLAVESGKLTAGKRYAVRGAILGPAQEVLWRTTQDHMVDPAAPRTDLGTLVMSRFSAPDTSTPTDNLTGQLRGGEWVVEDVNGGGVIQGSRATLTFATDAALTGRSFCNLYRGTYRLTGGSIAVSLDVSTASTLTACQPMLMYHERVFLDTLSAVKGFEVAQDGALILRSDDGRSIRARRQ